LFFLDLGEETGTLLLEKLTVRIVVLKGNAIRFHDIVVKELRRRVYGKATTIGHTKSLRHICYYKIRN
jgi:IS4 transposase